MESESWTGGTGLIYLSIPGAASVLGEPVQGSPICPGAALKTRTAEASAALGGWVGGGGGAGCSGGPSSVPPVTSVGTGPGSGGWGQAPGGWPVPGHSFGQRSLAGGGESSQNETSWGSGLLFQAWCGRSSLVLSAGESCGWGRALVSRHWEEGECQGEDRFWEGLAEILKMGFRSLLPKG